MNKKTCIMMINVQIGFFIFMLIIGYMDNYPAQKIFQGYFFPMASISIVLLSPFGIFSAISSFAIRFMFRQRLMSDKDVNRITNHPLFRFIVWDEVLVELQEGRRHEYSR